MERRVTNHRRLVLSSLATAGSVFALSVAPILSRAAAESDGLGDRSGGASMAFTFILGVSAVLAFLLGYGIRDYLQKRALRAKANRKPAPASPRA